jgi:hypothetical protein
MPHLAQSPTGRNPNPTLNNNSATSQSTGIYEIALFRKAEGPLSKRITLGKNGQIYADGSACKMWSGEVRRVKFDDAAAFAQLIGSMQSNEALALGRLRPEFPDQCRIVCKRDLNGSTANGVIAETAEMALQGRRWEQL